jgi:hypothetical protein
MGGATEGASFTQQLQAARRGVSALASSARQLWTSISSDQIALRFSQNSASPGFHLKGTFKGETIGSLAAKLRAGEISISDVPVRFVRIAGNNLIVNTRSALALMRAKIPQSLWTLLDTTESPEAYNNAAAIAKRLADNGLTSEGTEVIRITGAGKNASSLR